MTADEIGCLWPCWACGSPAPTAILVAARAQNRVLAGQLGALRSSREVRYVDTIRGMWQQAIRERDEARAEIVRLKAELESS